MALVLVVPVGIALLYFAWLANPFWVERHSSSYRCIRDEHTLATWQFLRLSSLGAAVFVLTVVRPWLARQLESSNVGWAGPARYGLAIIVALLCSEAYLRRPKPTPTAPPGYSPEHVPDPVLAWRLKPEAEHVWHQGGRDFSYAVNAEGNRALSIHADSNHERPTIFVSGESIAMGMGNPYQDSFAALLESRTGIQVVDVGVDAYGLDQACMRDREVVSSYPHVVAIVTIFHPEVAARAEVEDRPRLRVNANGGLELVPPTAPWIRDIHLRAILRGIYHSSAELDDLRAIVRSIAKLARDHAAYPLFVTVTFGSPCIDVEGKAPFLFRALFEDQNVPHIDVPLPASERLSDDMHPGPKAHVRMANAIEKALRDANVLGGS